MIRAQVLNPLPGAREGERGGSKEDVGRRVTASGAMKKSRYVTVIERKVIRGESTNECFPFRRVRNIF